MKNQLIYALVFLIAFVAVTGLVIIANENFTNIFAFDFSGKKPIIIYEEEEALTEETETAEVLNTDTTEVTDSTLAGDNLTVVDSKGDSLSQSKELINVPQLSQIKKMEPNPTPKSNSAQKDSSYLKWKKETVKLYEAMDSKIVAKLISNFSDDTARDLIYSMKKRKAAEVLSNLSPELAIRLTRAR